MEAILCPRTKNLRYHLLYFVVLVPLCGNVAAGEWALKRHSKDKNLSSKPALISYTDPKGSESSYTVDAALTYTFATQLNNIDGKFFVEGHKNTEAKKESDVISIGGAAEYPIDFNCSSGICDFIYIDSALEAKKNQVKRSESVQLLVDSKFYAPDWAVDSYLETSFGDIYWVPQVGIEVEDVIEADDGLEGHWIRTMTQIEVGIEMKLNEKSENRVRFYMVHTNWQDRSKSDRLMVDRDSHSLRVLGISYPIASSDTVEVSIDLTNVDGENIRTGTSNQEYTQFSFGVSF